MLLHWLTLVTAVKPLADVFSRVMFSTAVLYFPNDDSPPGSATTENSTATAAVPPAESVAGVTTAVQQVPKAVLHLAPTTVKSSVEEKSVITGVYSYKESVNFDNYLKELGVGWTLRTLASLATPIVIVSKQCAPVSSIWTCPPL